MSSNLSLPIPSSASSGQQSRECFGTDTLDRTNYTPSRVFKAC